MRYREEIIRLFEAAYTFHSIDSAAIEESMSGVLESLKKEATELIRKNINVVEFPDRISKEKERALRDNNLDEFIFYKGVEWSLEFREDYPDQNLESLIQMGIGKYINLLKNQSFDILVDLSEENLENVEKSTRAELTKGYLESIRDKEIDWAIFYLAVLSLKPKIDFR